MKHISFAPTAADLTQVGLASRTLALESNYLTSMAATITSALPRFVDKVRSFFTDLTPRLNFTATTLHRPSAFLQHINKLGYANTAQLSLFVPEGFSGSFLEYSSFLEDSTDHISKLHNGVLVPYRDFLASLLANPDALKSTAEPLRHLDRVEADRKKLSDRAIEFFTAGSVSTNRKLSEVIQRSSDWDSIFMKLQAVNRVTESHDTEAIRSLIEEISDLLDALKEASSDGSISSINPKQLKSLGDSTLIVAEEVGFMALTRHRITVFSTALESNITAVTEMTS